MRNRVDEQALKLPLPNELSGEELPAFAHLVDEINKLCVIRKHQSLGIFVIGPPAGGKTQICKALNQTPYFQGYKILDKKLVIYSEDYGHPIPYMDEDNKFVYAHVQDEDIEALTGNSIFIGDELDRLKEAPVQVVVRNVMDNPPDGVRPLVIFLGNSRFSRGTFKLAENFLTRVAIVMLHDNKMSSWEKKNGVSSVFSTMREQQAERGDAYYSCQRAIATATSKRACFWASLGYELSKASDSHKRMFPILLASLFEEETRAWAEQRLALLDLGLPTLVEIQNDPSLKSTPRNSDPASLQGHVDWLIVEAKDAYDWESIGQYIMAHGWNEPYESFKKLRQSRGF